MNLVPFEHNKNQYYLMKWPVIDKLQTLCADTVVSEVKQIN